MFRLPDATHIGHVHLRVPDLSKALGFYRDLLGLRAVSLERSHAVLSATGGTPGHILLSERPGARPRLRATTGLFHAAIRLPDRVELARVFRRLRERGWPFQGYSDHGVSEALYLTDADGNGLELYADRPRPTWPWRDGQVAMTTEPLDVASLLKEGGEAEWAGISPGADVGHTHLQVSDLGRAEAFYAGTLGLDVTQRSYPGALFLSAGGYHHHVALNVWAGVGAPPPPPDATGLVSFSLHVPNEEAWKAVGERLTGAGIPTERVDADTVLARDPDGNGVEIIRT